MPGGKRVWLGNDFDTRSIPPASVSRHGRKRPVRNGTEDDMSNYPLFRLIPPRSRWRCATSAISRKRWTKARPSASRPESCCSSAPRPFAPALRRRSDDRTCSRLPFRYAELPAWVGWHLVRVKGEPRKVPLDPRTGTNASVSDPRTWERSPRPGASPRCAPCPVWASYRRRCRRWCSSTSTAAWNPPPAS